MREGGCYWVKRYGCWVVGKWVSPYWYVPVVGFGLDGDSSLEEIDEHRITRPETP